MRQRKLNGCYYSLAVASIMLQFVKIPNYHFWKPFVQGQEQDEIVYNSFHDISASLRSLVNPTSMTGNWANDVNEQNDSSGTAVIGGYLRPWVWSSSLESALFLPIPDNRSYGGQGSMISDRFEVNKALVLGNLQIDVMDEPGRAYLWYLNMDTLEILDSFELPVWNGKDRTLAIAVNNRGQILAKSTKYWSLPDIHFVYDFLQDSIQEIEFPVGPVDMNNNGDLVGGTHIGINRIPGDFSTMQITDVGLPEFQVASVSLTAINDYGMASATLRKTYSDGAGRHTSAMSRYNGTTYDLNQDGGAFAGSIDISNNGNVLGVLGLGGSIVPAIYIHKANQTYTVNSLLDPQLATAQVSFYLYEANAMNNAGVIAGSITERGAALLIPRTTGVVNENCIDSTLFMRIGQLRKRSCQWVAKKPQQRCLKLKVETHCPITCGACAKNKCTDSRHPFQLQGKTTKTRCSWVKKKNTLARCKLPGVETTCRQTCKKCKE